MAAVQTLPNAQPAALTHAEHKGNQSRSMVEVVARQYGVSPFRQLADMWRLRGGRAQVSAKEYFEFELYRPDLTLAEKRQFVGDAGSRALNVRLSPPDFTHMRNFLADKVAFTQTIGAIGLPTTTIQACFHPFRSFGALTTLRDAAQIRAFLTGPARYPLFGKPIRGTGSYGSVSIVAIEDGAAQLSNGTAISLDELCGEIAATCATYGFVFQDAVIPHAEIAAITGTRAVSTIRVVTVNETDRPQVLYTLWKLPAAGAMSDNFWQAGSLISLLNAETGTVEKTRFGSGVETQWVDAHPLTGRPLTGYRIPNWQKVVDLARAAHGFLPDNGILGWDIALTDEGARLIECNANSYHGLYQLASGRGVLNADFAPHFAAIEARNAKNMAAFSRRKRAYESEKAWA